MFKKKEEVKFPKHFALIRTNINALSKGIDDDYNKIVVRYINGKIVSVTPYSDKIVECIKKVYNIPVVNDVAIEEDFDELLTQIDLGVLKYVK